MENFLTINVRENDVAEEDEEFSVIIQVDGQPTVTINLIIRDNDGT